MVKTVMPQPIDEIKMAAKLVEHEHFMGLCEGGFPLIAFVDRCQFCGADWNEKCGRRDNPADPNGESK